MLCRALFACNCFYWWSLQCFSNGQFRMFLVFTWLLWGFLLLCDMTWPDVIWFSCFYVAWHVVVSYFHVIWHSMTWFLVFMWYGMARPWHDFLFSWDMTWHDMTWHGHDMVWHDMSCGGLQYVLHDAKAQTLLQLDVCLRTWNIIFCIIYTGELWRGHDMFPWR